MTILYIEDDLVDQMTMKRLFRQLPEHQLFIDTSIENFKSTFDKKVDVIISDYYLPDGEAEEVLAFADDIPVILLSNSSHLENKDFFKILSKPLTIEILKRVLKELNKATEGEELDLAYLKEVAAGNEAFEREMLEIYIEEMPQELQALQEALNNQDWNTCNKWIHKMQTKLRIGGFKPLLEKALSLEDAYKAETLGKNPSMIELFIQDTFKTIKVVEAHLMNVT